MGKCELYDLLCAMRYSVVSTENVRSLSYIVNTDSVTDKET